jgi:hypothetical protein
MELLQENRLLCLQRRIRWYLNKEGNTLKLRPKQKQSWILWMKKGLKVNADIALMKQIKEEIQEYMMRRKMNHF